MSLCPLGRSKEISWKLESKTDSRWNKAGTSTVAMMFDIAVEAKNWIDKCKKKYGKVPKDLYYNGHKI